MGSNLLMVRPGQRFGPGADGAPNFKLADVEAIRAQITAIDAVAPVVSLSVTAVYQARNWSTMVTGSTNDYFRAGNWEIAAGRDFSETEERAGRAVCVIGETVRDKLFGAPEPGGQRDPHQAVLLRGDRPAQGQGPVGHGQRPGRHRGHAAAHRAAPPHRQPGREPADRVSVREGASIDAVKEQLVLLMRERRNIAENEDDNFRVMDTRQIAETLTGTTRILTMLLGAVAAVSLLVGGIGIMNIMLVSVTERTREIGIRLAIGALEREVLLQFLIEAVVLSSLGGLIGLALASRGLDRPCPDDGHPLPVRPAHQHPLLPLLRRHRGDLRLLPGPARGPAGPHRRPAPRVAPAGVDPLPGTAIKKGPRPYRRSPFFS